MATPMKMKAKMLFVLLFLLGISVSKRYDREGRKGYWCEQKTDCRGVLHCVNGKCRRSLGLEGWPCTERFDCDQKFRMVCINEKCGYSRGYGEECRFSHNCNMKLICLNGKCRTYEEYSNAKERIYQW